MGMSKAYVSTELRRIGRERAGGFCEYCKISESNTFATHEIEHIVAKKHRGETAVENLALSCSICNKHKGSDLTSIDPETDKTVRLYHPRKDLWEENFSLEQSGEITPLTAVGRVSVWLLQFNRLERIKEREILLQIEATKS